MSTPSSSQASSQVSSNAWSRLPATGTCDLTTTGRRSGAPRTVEIWYVVVDGRLYLVGTPGPRSWLANLVARPHATLALREPAEHVEVRGSVIRDGARRREITERAWALQPWYAEQGPTVDDWVAGSPIVELVRA